MLGQGSPLLGVGEVRTAPRARDVVGEEVAGDVRPAHCVVLGDAGPGEAVELPGLDRGLDLLQGQGHRLHSEAGQEAARGGEREHAQPLEVVEAADGVDGVEVARVPGPGAQPGDALDLAVGFLPDLVEPPLVEQHRHVQAVAAGEREVTAEHGDVHRRGDGVVVRLHRIHCAALHGAEQFAGGRELVREVQLDLHLAVGRLVERLDGGLDHVLGKRRIRVGLEPPPDLRLRLRVDRGRSHRGRARGAHHRRLPEKIASARHLFPSPTERSLPLA